MLKSLVSTTDIFPSRGKRRCKKFEKEDFEISEKRSVEIFVIPCFVSKISNLIFDFLSFRIIIRDEKKRKKERKKGRKERKKNDGP